MLRPQPNDTLQLIATRINIPESVIAELNDIKSDDEIPKNNELVVPERVPRSVPGVRELTVGDLMERDFDALLLKIDPPVFIVQYYTVKGVALGKLTLTDFEIIFEPLNPKLKGFINQECNVSSR
jgi:LysM repeat protein